MRATINNGERGRGKQGGSPTPWPQSRTLGCRGRGGFKGKGDAHASGFSVTQGRCSSWRHVAGAPSVFPCGLCEQEPADKATCSAASDPLLPVSVCSGRRLVAYSNATQLPTVPEAGRPRAGCQLVRGGARGRQGPLLQGTLIPLVARSPPKSSPHNTITPGVGISTYGCRGLTLSGRSTWLSVHCLRQ